MVAGPLPEKLGVDAVVEQISQVLVGKTQAIKLTAAALIADGHVLIEDIPGVGKTTLAHSFACSLGLRFNRVQFTSDMLPADILGVSIFDHSGAQFQFHKGPVFCNLLMADEINRANPKTQSALLEAMAEQQVSVDGISHELERPFSVIATQNPLDYAGTFPLPDSQLDRFLICIRLGYPDEDAERTLLKGPTRRELLQQMEPVLSRDSLLALQLQADQVMASEPLLDYVLALLTITRSGELFKIGLSPRAGLALLRCSKAYALISGRNYCLPEDIQRIFPALSRHRLHLLNDTHATVDDAIADLLKTVPIP